MISTLLKNQPAIFRDIIEKRSAGKMAAIFFATSIAGIALYALTLTANQPSWHLFWELTWKAVLLFWGSTLLCVPLFYVLTAIGGSTIRVREIAFALLAYFAVAGIILVAVCPIVWFFVWSSGIADYGASFVIAGLSLLFGITTIGRFLSYIHEERKATQPESRTAVAVLILWLFALIPTMVQMMEKLDLL